MLIPIKTIVFVVLLAVGVIALEVYLATRKSRAAGLVLPVVVLLPVLFVLPNVVLTSAAAQSESTVFLSILLGLSVLFLPALVLFGIYALCRRRMAQKARLDKMKIQDL